MAKIAKLFVLIVLMYQYQVSAQTKKVSRDWTSFTQTIEVTTDTKTKFKLEGLIKVERTDTTGVAALWARVDNVNGESGFFDNMLDRPATSNEWKTYTIEGEIDKNAETINFGGLCLNNGKYYFDDIRLLIENKEGVYEPISLTNASFEDPVKDELIPGWAYGIGKGNQVMIKEFTAQTVKNKKDGSKSLLIEGNNIVNSFVIKTDEEFSPQIGVMISMLNNLSKRVESRVEGLDIRETDHLMDEKANRIGALVMHLAAAEAYYQVFTFENRGFNDEEKEKWMTALELGDKARELYQGKPIEYYLNIYKEVRKKTIEEFKKRDDNWLNDMRPGSVMNNHYAWFHVMEHQSSHLGQILMMAKRIPEEKEQKKIEVKKNVDQ
ncbi:mycothiol transferase [Aquimarina sp. 433]